MRQLQKSFCFVGRYITDAQKLVGKYNDVNVLKCRLDKDGECDTEVLEQKRGRPCFS